jgi:hypothetical protein
MVGVFQTGHFAIFAKIYIREQIIFVAQHQQQKKNIFPFNTVRSNNTAAATVQYVQSR